MLLTPNTQKNPNHTNNWGHQEPAIEQKKVWRKANYKRDSQKKENPENAIPAAVWRFGVSSQTPQETFLRLSALQFVSFVSSVLSVSEMKAETVSNANEASPDKPTPPSKYSSNTTRLQSIIEISATWVENTAIQLQSHSYPTVKSSITPIRTIKLFGHLVAS